MGSAYKEIDIFSYTRYSALGLIVHSTNLTCFSYSYDICLLTMNTSKKVSDSSSENELKSPSLSSKRSVEAMLNNSILIEEVTIEYKVSEPVRNNYDITWEEWYTDVSDEESDEEWLESFLLEPRITEIDIFDDICNQLEEVSNAIIEECEELEAFYRQSKKRSYVTFRERFSHDSW
ncbi:hypothetical protein K7432_003823 [Basidiobolus ranarum]|uniref:Uncharacterized protein n=1 Tax=Basidiobolus ranarum TaxID=34480 RepID=A0ABR2WZ58_9FUNG